MKKLTLTEANAFLAELMRAPEGDPAILMRGKKPIAVILPVGDADLETVALSFSPKFNAILRRSQRSAELGRTYSSEEIRREFGLPPYHPQRGKTNGRKVKSRRGGAKAGTHKRKVGS
jgi:hypothetical protein